MNKCKRINPVNPDISGKLNQIMFSGHLKVFEGEEDNSSLYFIFTGKKGVTKVEDLSKYPLIIYILGGPGAPTTNSFYVLNGPLILKRRPDGTIVEEINEDPNLTDEFNVIFIDQPIGVGNSFCQNKDSIPLSTPNELSDEFFQALQNLYNIGGDQDCQQFFQKYYSPTSQGVYIAGISYAGKYIPGISYKIMNERNNKKYKQLNLKGIMMGNGFTHPMNILSELAAFSYDTGLIDFPERMQMEQQLLKVQILINNLKWKEANDLVWTIYRNVTKNSGGSYWYNYFLYSDPYDWSAVQEFFSQKNPITGNFYVKEQYFVPQEVPYDEFGRYVFYIMGPDIMQPITDRLEYCLDEGLKVLYYQGRDDLIVSNKGLIKQVDNLNWKGSQQFLDQEYTLIQSKRKQFPSGYKKKWQNLELFILHNGGHFIEKLEGGNCVDIFKEFIENP